MFTPSSSSRQGLARVLVFSLVIAFVPVVLADETAPLEENVPTGDMNNAIGTAPPPAESAQSGPTTTQIIDRLPAFLADRLPLLDPNGRVEVSVRPRLGDLFHKGYFRVPVGARWQVTDYFEMTTELSNYFSQGDAGSEGSGISGMSIGGKFEHVLPSLNEDGFSVGLDYRTPFRHSPLVFTDGYRHVQPYIAATRRIFPKYRLLGYANLAANFFQHTNLPSNFGRNELHANSLALVTGVARDWNRFHISLTARLASTELTSDEGRQNFQLRPEIAFPIRFNLKARTQIYLTLGGRVIWGPDGRQTNTNGGVRVDFHLDHPKRKTQLPDGHFRS